MAEKVIFGVIGGYGETGRVAVTQLYKFGTGNILIGGRDLGKASALAAELGDRVSAAQVDVLDPKSLVAFCSRTSVIINCASPVMVLQDRVAQAALHARCHYVDAAGLGVVKERLLPQSAEIEKAGLSFVISAGWLPGMSEFLPVYAEVQARRKMESVESVTVYLGDTDDWSPNALREAVWLIRKLGTSRRGYFRNAEWVRAGLLRTWRKADIGGQLGVRQFALFATPEMNDVAKQLKNGTLLTYACVPGVRVLIATILATLPLPQGWCARRLRNALRKNRLPVGGFITVEIKGRSDRQSLRLTEQIAYARGRGYWMNGLVPATVANMIAARNGVVSGLHFLPDAVDPLTLMSELHKAGVEGTETLAAVE